MSYQASFVVRRTRMLSSCQERLTAFAACGVPDPLEYQSRDIIAKA